MKGALPWVVTGVLAAVGAAAYLALDDAALQWLGVAAMPPLVLLMSSRLREAMATTAASLMAVPMVRGDRQGRDATRPASSLSVFGRESAE